MCKEYPGPRCSNHVRKQKRRLEQQLMSAQASHEPDSLNMKQAVRDYEEIVETYKSTPDGLKEVAQQNPHELPYYQKTRDFQTEAYKEENNGRVENIAKFITSTQTFYDQDEVRSIIQNTRREEENHALASIRNGEMVPLQKQDTSTEYATMLQKYQEYGQRTNGDEKALATLKDMPTPTEPLTVNVYRNVFQNLQTGRVQLKKELHRIATLQDTSTQVVEAYYDAYRKQYQSEYAHLDKKEQPNPPKEWVEGVYSDTGFQKTQSTSMMPNDPASMYACYRLRADANAIPDYLKHSRNFTTVQVNSEQQTITIASANSKGKKLSQSVLPYSPQLTPSVGEALEGKVLLLDNNKKNIDWVKDIRSQGLTTPIITTSDISNKHLNLPDRSTQTFCQSADVDYTAENKANALLSAYFKNRQTISRQWSAKSARKNARPVDGIPLDSRFITRT